MFQSCGLLLPPCLHIWVAAACEVCFDMCSLIGQDEAGALWRAKLPSFEMEKLLEFHAGPIVAVASSPTNFQLASAGSDGTVSLSLCLIVSKYISEIFLTCVCFQIYNLIPLPIPFAYGKKKIQH